VQETEFNCKNEKNILFFEIFSKWTFFPQKNKFSDTFLKSNKLV